MTEIITIAGHKGGSGKTATAVNLAAALALYEKKTLLVDGDPLGFATAWTGVKHGGGTSDLFSVVTGKATASESIKTTQLEFMDILPSGLNLYKDFTSFPQGFESPDKLRQAVRQISRQYNYIIIDCPSSFSFMSLSALIAGDWIISPFSCEADSVMDLKNLLKTIKFIKNLYHIPLKVAGIFLNFCRSDFQQSIEDRNSLLKRKAMTDIKDIVFSSSIPHDILIKEMDELRKPVLLHDLEAVSSKAYLKFALEIISFLT